MNHNFLTNSGHIPIGVCYYPEHWEEAIWEDDLGRMKECGIEVIRIAEFAWNKFEPAEGTYTFDFFDRFMALAEREGMDIIFCTPTAAPPLWLSEKYPEILNADLDGNRYYHGTRRHYNLTSPVYHEFTRKITEVLAEHYVSAKNVVGWQLDNEINCENDLYYSESDHNAFREYCKRKYGTLDNFNKKMGTVFWNQTYTDWSQVHLARRTNTYGQTNPHLQLEEKRFISESVYSYFKLQADIIRKYQKSYGRTDQFITTNGLFSHIDYQRLTKDVFDFITFDNYPAFAFENTVDFERTNGLKDRNSSWNLARTRSISEIFGIMEEQSGAGGWNCRMMMPMPKPGQMRLWAFQAIAHGANFISFFRWRTATMGTEIYWHGLLDYDGRENRRIRELKKISEDVKKMTGHTLPQLRKQQTARSANFAGEASRPYVQQNQPSLCPAGEITAARYEAKIAILCDYDNEWDGENDIWHGQLRKKSMDSFFSVLQKSHIPFDFLYVEPDTDFSALAGYDFLIWPHAAIFTEKRLNLLKSAVTAGKTVIFGCRSGYKDEWGHCTRMPMPGYIEQLCGCTVEEYTYISPQDAGMVLSCPDGTGDAILFCDMLAPTEGEVMAVFQGGSAGTSFFHYEGKPAIVRKKSGEGSGWYVGSAFAESTAELVIKMTGMEKAALFRDEITIPETVELAVRKGEQHSFIFLLNYEGKPAEITVQPKAGRKFTDVLTGDTADGNLKIDSYDFLVLQVQNT